MKYQETNLLHNEISNKHLAESLLFNVSISLLISSKCLKTNLSKIIATSEP